jgi:hypothetical protein
MNNLNWRIPKLVVIISSVLLFSFLLLPKFSPEIVNANAGDIYVSVNGGADTATCGAQSQPCASIQHAVNRAVSGQTIRVAAGTYTYNATTDVCGGAVAVVCIRNKGLSIIGGYNATTWAGPNPAANLTIIDGQNSTRGILMQRGSSPAANTLVMEGFTVQNGRVQGASSGPDPEIFAFGGGLQSDNSITVLRRMVFRNNRAVGGGAENSYGGAGSGGAVAIRGGQAGTTLQNITFTNNQAIGGDGQERGGYGIGGALYFFNTVANVQNITASSNISRGGNSNGSGRVNGENADSQGGGIAVQRDSNVQFQNITVTNNQAIGGNAPNGQGGGSFGGGIFAENARLTITDGLVQGNVAQGGTGRNEVSGGSIAVGGGVSTDQTFTVLDRVRVINNRASGGNGVIISGTGGGGGGAFVRQTGDSTVSIVNSVFADNLAEMGSTGTKTGGGGGGITVRGTALTIQHTTFARNRLGAAPMQGNSILLLNDGAATASTATIANSIVANHSEYSGAIALHVKPGNTANLQAVLFDGNSTDTGGGGTINGLGNIIAGPVNFQSPGAPNYDYRILGTSAARDASVNSSLAIDIDQEARDNRPDIGAHEYQRPAITAVYGVPTASSTILVHWQTVNMDGALSHFELTINCPSGGSSPSNINCSVPVNVGTQMAQYLSGLTNYVSYNVTVRAYSTTGTILCEKNINVTPMDQFLYLPLVTQ